MKVLELAQIMAGPTHSIAQMLAHPQTAVRELPIKFSPTPGKVTRAAELLGQHTREVLAEFGFAEGEIEALVASGAALAA
ncbi:MAG TPA: hypothetical protein VNE59_01885 [Burkholderiales bacterium]|nr:hypothetical protein [Burkholderiales bacterium]